MYFMFRNELLKYSADGKTSYILGISENMLIIKCAYMEIQKMLWYAVHQFVELSAFNNGVDWKIWVT